MPSTNMLSATSIRVLIVAALVLAQAVEYIFDREFNKRDPKGAKRWDTMRDMAKLWSLTGRGCYLAARVVCVRHCLGTSCRGEWF